MFEKLYDEQGIIHEDLLERVPCNLCGASSYTPWAIKHGLSIVQCSQCGLIYVNPRLNAQGRQIAYSDDYFTLQSDPEDSRKRQEMYVIEIRDLERTIHGGRILDVGAGGGHFLASLGSHWEKHGCEINDVSASYAREQHGLAVRTGELRDLLYPSDYFDCVNVRGVIEHLPDPLGDLKETYRILKPGGVVSINTPNIDSLCARLYRGDFRLVDPRFHIYYFSPRTMRMMLERAGFRVLREVYFYLDTPYADPVADLIKIVTDLARKQTEPSLQAESPPFFENVLNIYAVKENAHD